MNSKKSAILKFIVAERSLATFVLLSQVIQGWACCLYISDAYKVYPCLIDDCDHLVSKTAMTRVEGENCRLRHYLARLDHQTLCYSKSVEMLKASVGLLIYYLKPQQIPQFT